MKYLVFAVFQAPESGEVFTHSKDIDLGAANPKDEAEKIIDDISTSGLGRDNLWEVFVFGSAIYHNDPPEQVAYWNLDDGLFGEQEEEDEEDDTDDPQSFSIPT